MTRDEIMAMPAGPELNRLIAERVMGFVSIGPTTFADGLRLRILGDDFDPSDDIAGAWEVIERMRPTHHFGLDTHGDFWRVQIGTRGRNDIIAAFGPLPLALCRAALLAVMS